MKIFQTSFTPAMSAYSAKPASLLSSKNVTFRGVEMDTVSFSSNVPPCCTSDSSKGKFVKEIELKNKENETVQGAIYKYTDVNDKYFVLADDAVLCRMKTCKDPYGVFIDTLYSANDNGKYKGAGSALLKLAVEKSRERDTEGRVCAIMDGSYPFYFKNNFRVSSHHKDYLQRNALLDYITRNDAEVDKIWPGNWRPSHGVLDKRGADALMNGERLYAKTLSGSLGKKDIEYTDSHGTQTASGEIDFSDLGDNNFVLQFIESFEEKSYQTVCVIMKLSEDDSGRKYFDVKETTCLLPIPEYKDAVVGKMFEALDEKMKEAGAEYIKADNETL